MCRVTGIAHNHGRFLGEVGIVCVLQGGKWATDGLPSCGHYALQGFSIAVLSMVPW